MSLFGNLQVASNALLSHQRGLASVNKNITNVSTKGYKREIPLFQDLPKNGGIFDEAKRIYNERLQNRYFNTNNANSYNQTLASDLQAIEESLNDTQGSGFKGVLDDFFKSMNDIMTAPDNLAAREAFLADTQSLVGRIRDSYDYLEQLKSANHGRIKDLTTKLNDTLTSLAKVNKAILYESNALDNDKYNTYLNQRDQLLEKVSSLIDTKIRYNDNGTVDIFSAKGHPLVMGKRAFKVEVQNQPENITISDGSNSYDFQTLRTKLLINGVDLTNDFAKGEMGAKLETERTIVDMQTRLNTFTYTFTNAINTQHQAGYDLNGDSGGALFGADNGASHIDASNIKLAIHDPAKVAAAADSTTIQADNENIKALFALKENKYGALQNQSFQEFYNASLINHIGSKSAHLQNVAKDSQALFEAISSKVEELSGVNIDEELMNMQQLQRGYQASARIITVTNTLLDTVMGLVR